MFSLWRALTALCVLAALCVCSESVAQDARDVTLRYAENDARFGDNALCAILKGQITMAAGQQVCSNMDRNDTFCIVGSADGFPCRGLYKHVLVCNNKYGRTAANPFFCGVKCSPGQRASGAECRSAADGHVIVTVAAHHASPCRDIPPGAASECDTLREAAQNNNADCAALLISDGEDLDEKTATGETLLHEAAEEDSCRVAEVLAEHGAPVTVANDDGATPLHFAATLDSAAIAELLLNNGADANINATTSAKQTALDLAIVEQKRPVWNLLESRGGICIENCCDRRPLGDVDTVDGGALPCNLRNGAFANDVGCLQDRIDAGDNANASFIPLQQAAGHDACQAVRFLLENGANIEGTDPIGSTALHKAAAGGALETVRFLISKGAEVNAKTNFNKTPWDNSADYPAVRALLEMHGGKTGISPSASASNTE